MSLKYKVVKQVLGFDKDGGEKYILKAVTGEMLPFKKVCNQVCQITGMHRGVVNLIIGGLLDVMVNSLEMGHSVQLGDFGTIRPGLRTKAQDSEEKANAKAIYRKKINIVPGKMLKNCLNDAGVIRAAQLSDTTDSGDNQGDLEDPDA